MKNKKVLTTLLASLMLFCIGTTSFSISQKKLTKKSWYKKAALYCAGAVGIGGSVWLMYSLWKKNVVTRLRAMSTQDIVAQFDREKIDYRKALARDPVITFDKA